MEKYATIATGSAAPITTNRGFEMRPATVRFEAPITHPVQLYEHFVRVRAQ